MPSFFLRPDSTELNESSAWAPTGAATLHEAIDEVNHSAGDYILCNSSGGPRSVGVNLSSMTDALSIEKIVFRIWALDDFGGGSHTAHQPYLQILGTRYDGASHTLTSVEAEYTDTWATNPSTTMPWTKAQLDDLVARVEQAVAATTTGRITQLEIEVFYTPIPAGQPAAREIGTQYLRQRRRPREVAPLVLGPASLDLELGDDFSFTHFDQVAPDSPVLSLVDWRRLLLMKTLEEWDPMAGTVYTEGVRREDMLVNCYDGGESRRSGSAAEDGVARLTAGGALVYTRNSKAWIEDPASLLATELGIDAKPLTAGGTAMESVAKNYLIHSSFISGAATGWTRTGVGGTATAGAPADPVFHPDVHAQAVTLVRGGANNVYTSSVSESIPINSNGRLLIDHRDVGSAVLSYQLSRAVDGLYWNDATAAWAAGPITNALAVRNVRARDFTKPIAFGGTATTVTVVLLQAGANGDTSLVHHVEVVDTVAITSRIVTNGAGYTRAAGIYSLAHTTAKRTVSVTQGTFLREFVPGWSTGDLTGTIVMWQIGFSAGNSLKLQFNTGTGNFEFVMRAGGVDYTTTKAATIVRGTAIRLVARWTSTISELGLPARTISVFVNAVKGTDAVRGADPTEGSASLYLGGDNGGADCQGLIRRTTCTQRVMTDEEIARFAA